MNLYKMKRDELVYNNGLTQFDIERVSLLIDSVLLCHKACLRKFTLRDIIHSIYNTIKIDLERCIERNKAIVERNLNRLSESVI